VDAAVFGASVWCPGVTLSSPITFIKKVKTPTLVHGDRDSRGADAARLRALAR
jgi:hypothetical protein